MRERQDLQERLREEAKKFERELEELQELIGEPERLSP